MSANSIQETLNAIQQSRDDMKLALENKRTNSN